MTIRNTGQSRRDPARQIKLCSALQPLDIQVVDMTRGTQDVNDPRTALGPQRGAIHGVVHVLGSASPLIGTRVGGGTGRRPNCRAVRVRNSLQAERVSAARRTDDRRLHASVRDVRPG